MLVEAKAHWNELSGAGKPKPRTANGWRNHERVDAAIQEANTALNSILSGWALSRDLNYQLSNRFAWAYKLASLRVPVMLIYLGFLSADEMGDCGQPFRTTDDWGRAVRSYGAGMVPDRAWGDRGDNPLDVGGTPLWALIRSEQVAFPSQGGWGGMG